MRMQVRSLTLIRGLRIRRCGKLWCTSLMQLRFGVAAAVVQAGSCSSDSTPSLRTSICCGCSPKKWKEKKRKREKGNDYKSSNRTHNIMTVLLTICFMLYITSLRLIYNWKFIPLNPLHLTHTFFHILSPNKHVPSFLESAICSIYKSVSC